MFRSPLWHVHKSHFHDLVSDFSSVFNIAVQLRTVKNGLEDMDENFFVFKSISLSVK